MGSIILDSEMQKFWVDMVKVVVQSASIEKNDTSK